MATTQFLGWVERQAQRMRRQLSLSALAPLDPYLLAPKMKKVVLTPRDIVGLSEEDLHQMLVADADSWDAGSVPLPGGRTAILLNLMHTETRKRATLMEELSHVHLGHTPSQLILVGGLAVRSFKKTQKTHAYWVGAAALVPLEVLQDAQLHGTSKADVAGKCGVSVALIRFRENVTGIKIC